MNIEVKKLDFEFLNGHPLNDKKITILTILPFHFQCERLMPDNENIINNQ
jgi:hypothetical protein